MDREIEHAWSIQKGFLVRKWPEAQRTHEVYGETLPAKTVGGDFYDYIELDEEHVGILIGDVSGKGVPAALTMAQLLAEFRMCAPREASPAAVLAAMNEAQIGRSRHGTFCTISYVILNIRTGAAQCANAGHHACICVGAKGRALIGEASGPPVGVVPGTSYNDTSFSLSRGDSVLLYTDGIIEARGTSSQSEAEPTIVEFGVERLGRVAHRFHESSPCALINRVNHAVTSYCGNQAPHDDCTMIALKYLGAGEDKV
jgi:sigma-B regulation protein RsbU (phosphoserine phosphatase)